MGTRANTRPRCPDCGLHQELCACAQFPRLELGFDLVVVQHVRERGKPTNTGRLLAKMIPGVRIVHFPLIDRTFDEEPLSRPDTDYRVLFPRDDAEVLQGVPAPAGRRRGFVLLDGTWHQCSRMTRRVPRVRDMECVALPPGPPSIWGVRTQHDQRGMSTFEAGLRIVEIVEGEATASPLRRAFEIVTARMLFMKGKLPTPDVPPDWPGGQDPPVS